MTMKLLYPLALLFCLTMACPARAQSFDHSPWDRILQQHVTEAGRVDYAALIEKKQLDSLRYVREVEAHAKRLLTIAPDNADAYLALGAANYILGCLPVYKRFFLWFGGIRGDRMAGMEQLRRVATRGHYLMPFAKMLLALAAPREKQPDLARFLLTDLTREFPGQPLFARELALLNKPRGSLASSP